MEGTLIFLREEKFIREFDTEQYQLTSKGFSHLNKEFFDSTLADSERTYISAIKSVLSISTNITSGVAVNVIPNILKGG